MKNRNNKNDIDYIQHSNFIRSLQKSETKVTRDTSKVSETKSNFIQSLQKSETKVTRDTSKVLETNQE